MIDDEPQPAAAPEPQIVHRLVEVPAPRRGLRPSDTVIVGHSNGFPIKAGERFSLAHAFDAKPPARRKLKPVRPNLGIQSDYRKKIMRLVRDMADSVQYWLRAAYRADPPVMAQDATPASELQAAVAKLAKQWQHRFDDAAPLLAEWFATSARNRSDAMLRKILRDAGISVKFKMTPAMRDVFQATVQENVGLIKSIPQQYLGEVQGLVMRSVQTGRDLGFLTKELVKRYGITERRAAFIALDQNNKSTAVMQRVRQTDLGIENGIWQHSHAGREPRPTHLANDGKPFSLAKGWYDPDKRVRRRILPGELPRCRCSWRPVVKGFS